MKPAGKKHVYVYPPTPVDRKGERVREERLCGQQEIQQRVGDQQQQQKPLQQQEEKVAKIHSSSKRKK